MPPTRKTAGLVRAARALAAAAILCLCGAQARAEAPPRNVEAPPLNVAVYDLEPYGGVNADGAFTGASVDLWRRVAKMADLRYRFIAVKKIDAILSGLREGSYDVAVGAITITPERSALVDFSYPGHRSGVAIATQRRLGQFEALFAYGLAAMELSSLVAAAAVTMLLFGVLMWFIERPGARHSPDDPVSSVVSLRDGVYWAVVTMTTVGYGDKTPKTPVGRLVAIFWMLGSFVLISLLSATLVSKLTAERVEEAINLVGADLSGKRLTAAAASSGAEYLETLQLPYTKRETLLQALQALHDGEADVAVNSVGAMRHLVSAHFSRDLHVQRELLAPAYMAFALPQNSALKKPIDRALMRVTASPEWRQVEETYFLH